MPKMAKGATIQTKTVSTHNARGVAQLLVRPDCNQREKKRVLLIYEVETRYAPSQQKTQMFTLRWYKVGQRRRRLANIKPT